MSDLDVIREARDYLAGLIEGAVPGPWEVDGDGLMWWRDPANPGFSLCAGRSAEARTARLIMALRAAAPFLLGAMDEAIEFWGYLDEPGRALDLAKAILATKGQE